MVAPVAGTLADRIGKRPLVVLGLTLQAVGFAWIALIADRGLRLLGDDRAADDRAGPGSRWRCPAAQNAVLSAVGAADLGKASGTSTMMRQLGGVFGLAIAVGGVHGRRQLRVAGRVQQRFRPGDGGRGGAVAGRRADRALIPGRRAVRLTAAASAAPAG